MEETRIDSRTEKDIEDRIEELAKSYVPEWNYDRKDPDIGSAIARIFALQMKENIDLENSMIEKYHARFINMLDLSLLPAKPANSMVKIDLVENTEDGMGLKKGTRLLGEEASGTDSQVVFETDRDIYVTASRITDAFMTDREDGTFVPLCGDFAPAPLIEGNAEVLGDERQEEAEPAGDEILYPESSGTAIRPFVLFSGKGSIAEYALALYHESLFDIEDEPVYIRFSQGDEIIKAIFDGKMGFFYYSEHGFEEFLSERILEDNRTVELVKHEKNRHVTIGGRSYGVVLLRSKDPVKADMEVKGIGLSSSGKERSAEFVSDGSQDLDTSSFAPFSDTLSLYNECYIGHDLYFGKAGAAITVTFHTRFTDRGLYLTKQEEDAGLKIIKKKPRVAPSDIPADAFADEICLEYFNGLGWKKLPCREDYTAVFSKAQSEDVTLAFTCPSDWEPVQAGAYSGKAIRMRLLRSDNCYLRPCIHHYPVIEDLKISFSYEGNYVDPSKLVRISGTQKKDITSMTKTGKLFAAMSGGVYSDDALYLGFDRRMESGPVSIYFELDDVQNMTSLKCVYEYSTEKGFRRMKVADSTRDFSRSGTVFFMPPSDMKEEELEGRKRFWIRIRREHAGGDRSALFLPHIKKVLLNVVNVSNTVTGALENYYISEAVPNQRIALGEGNIMDAEVWVNERDSMRPAQIKEYQEKDPGGIDVERDALGNITAVFVRWQETDSFLNVTDRRSYMIDRFTNELMFSDGIRADMPLVTDDVSVKVGVRTTDGQAGNVAAGVINQATGNGVYLGDIYNPVRAYGGSNMETVQEALKRGANLLFSRRRLISAPDFIFTILSFSKSIDKASCIPGERIEGVSSPGDISFVLLMKDFREGSFSFHRIEPVLKKHLLENSFASMTEDNIFIVEPLFVRVSVTVWISVDDMDEAFEAQGLIRKTLEEYLDPVSKGEDEGWEIGNIPQKAQIQMRLGSQKSGVIIRSISAVAHFVDADGEHECDLSDVKVNPFMVVCSGEHTVRIIQS